MVTYHRFVEDLLDAADVQGDLVSRGHEVVRAHGMLRLEVSAVGSREILLRKLRRQLTISVTLSRRAQTWHRQLRQHREVFLHLLHKTKQIQCLFLMKILDKFSKKIHFYPLFSQVRKSFFRVFTPHLNRFLKKPSIICSQKNDKYLSSRSQKLFNETFNDCTLRQNR